MTEHEGQFTGDEPLDEGVEILTGDELAALGLGGDAWARYDLTGERTPEGQSFGDGVVEGAGLDDADGGIANALGAWLEYWDARPHPADCPGCIAEAEMYADEG